jgi:hypothetical protein
MTGRAGKLALHRDAGGIGVEADGVVIDGALLASLLGVPASDLQALMREGRITSKCEEGAAEHHGQLRLTFFHGNRRACVSIDRSGRILTQSIIDFGSESSARAARSR